MKKLKLLIVAVLSCAFSFSQNAHTDNVTNLSFSIDGKMLASSSNDKTVKIWDVESRKLIRKIFLGSPSIFASFTKDNKEVVTAAKSDNRSAKIEVKIWNIETGNELRTIEGSEDGDMFYECAFDPNGEFLVTGSKNNKLLIFDFETGDKIRTVGYTEDIKSLKFTHGGNYLFVLPNAGPVTLFDSYSWTPFVALPNIKSCAMAGSNDGTWLVMFENWGTNFSQETMHVYNSKTKSYTLQKADLNCEVADIKNGSSIIAAAFGSPKIKIFDLDKGKKVKELKGQMAVTQLEVEKYNKLVEVGNAARGSLYEIEAQAALDKVNLTDAQNNLTISLINLAQLLDLDTVSNFDIAEPVELQLSDLVVPDSVETIYGEALSLMPQIKSAAFQLKRSEKFLFIEQGTFFPSLSVTGAYSSRYSEDSPGSYFDQLEEYQNKQVSLNLSIPIFTKWSNRTRVNNAKINYLDSKYNYDQSLQILYKEIQQAHADAKAALQNYNSRSESVKASEENYKYNQQKFDVGIINSVDYNIAKNNYAKAQSDLLQAKYQYIFKTKILDFYRGKAIAL